MSENPNPIKEIRITLAKEPGTLKAFASVTLEVASGHALVLRGLKVIEGVKGLFVSYPAQKGAVSAEGSAPPDGAEAAEPQDALHGELKPAYYDYFFFLDVAANESLKDAVLAEFLRVAAQ